MGWSERITGNPTYFTAKSMDFHGFPINLPHQSSFQLDPWHPGHPRAFSPGGRQRYGAHSLEAERLPRALFLAGSGSFLATTDLEIGYPWVVPNLFIDSRILAFPLHFYKILYLKMALLLCPKTDLVAFTCTCLPVQQLPEEDLQIRRITIVTTPARQAKPGITLSPTSQIFPVSQAIFSCCLASSGRATHLLR